MKYRLYLVLLALGISSYFATNAVSYAARTWPNEPDGCACEQFTSAGMQPQDERQEGGRGGRGGQGGPPGGRGQGGPPGQGGPGGPGRGGRAPELGQVMPPFVVEQLNLS